MSPISIDPSNAVSPSAGAGHSILACVRALPGFYTAQVAIFQITSRMRFKKSLQDYPINR